MKRFIVIKDLHSQKVYKVPVVPTQTELYTWGRGALP